MAKKKQKQRKPQDDIEVEAMFDCQKGCFHINGKATPQICSNSPCPLNLEKFGTHTRIIQYYLGLEDWDSAYYYLDNLTSQSIFDCDVTLLYDVKKSIKKPKLKDLPLGCRIFKLEDKLNKMLSLLNDYKSKTDLSQTGQENYEQMIVDFRQTILSNLKILKHVTMDKRNATTEKALSNERVIEYFQKAIEAKTKFALTDVKPPDIIEEHWKDEAEKAGVLTPGIKEVAAINKKKIEIARKEMERDKILEEVQKYLESDQDIPDELKEKLKNLK